MIHLGEVLTVLGFIHSLFESICIRVVICELFWMLRNFYWNVVVCVLGSWASSSFIIG